MAAIAFESVSGETVRRLERLADGYPQDVAKEALDCLERGLREREEIKATLTRIRAFHATMPNAWLTDELLREAKAECR